MSLGGGVAQDIPDNALAASIDYIHTNILQVSSLALCISAPTSVTLVAEGRISVSPFPKLVDQMLLEVSNEEFEAALSHF